MPRRRDHGTGKHKIPWTAVPSAGAALIGNESCVTVRSSGEWS
jgi:hypothetical protein